MIGHHGWKCIFAFVLMGVLLLTPGETCYGADAETLERMEELIKKQQEQLDAQSKAIEELKRQVRELKTGSETATSPVPETATPGKEEEKIMKAAEPKKEEPSATALPGDVVRSRDDKVRVELYGQVNRGVLYSNDGNKSNWYFVDNENSQTRVGLLGKASRTKELDIGTWIELGLQSNGSDLVSQKDQTADFDLRDRHLEVYVESERYGKLWVGRGHTSSDGTSEVDFSGTDVIGYSLIADMAGGQLFFDSNTNGLSDTDIGNVFTNMDGLSRQDRVRYDTPAFYGSKVSGSASSEGALDAALRYSAKFGDIKFAAAAAYAYPSGLRGDVTDQVNGSVSALHGSGINATFAAGVQSHGTAGRDNSTFYYGKLGFKRHFFEVGMTAVSLDFSRSDQVDQNDDRADTFGAQLVQNFEEWGTEYYLGYRFHDLDRPDTSFKSINAMLTGLRVKF